MSVSASEDGHDALTAVHVSPQTKGMRGSSGRLVGKRLLMFCL